MRATAFTEHFDHDQQQQARDVQPRGPVAQQRRRHARNQQHQRAAEHEARALIEHQMLIQIARAVQGHQPD